MTIPTHIVAVGGLVTNNKDEVLMIRDECKGWIFPGGQVEIGESLPQALNTSPKIILFDEPSRGIDVNAKQQIFQIIWDLSRKGISSIVVSSELEELLEVCHRILIIKQGQITVEVRPKDLKIDDLYSLCMGGKIS